MPRYKAITLDLWDTLIQEVPQNNPTLGKLRVEEVHSELKSFGHDYDLGLLDRAYKLSGDFCNEIWSKGKDVPTDDHLLFMLACIDSKLTSRLKREEYVRLKKIYAETLLKHPPMLLEGSRQTLEALSSKGYRIGLISNTGRTPGDVLRTVMSRMKIDRFFDRMTFSNEVLIRKPTREIFLATLREIHSKPKYSVHVGNDPEDDFEGAKGAGMNAILLDRDAKSSKDQETIHSLAELVDLL